MKIVEITTHTDVVYINNRSITVYINPTLKEIKRLSKKWDLRGTFTNDGVFIWNAADEIHPFMRKNLGVSTDQFIDFYVHTDGVGDDSGDPTAVIKAHSSTIFKIDTSTVISVRQLHPEHLLDKLLSMLKITQ